MRDHMNTNRRFWDEAVVIHVASNFYDVASFKAGKSTLLPIERAELGSVRDKTLLHLQCHFGMDTLSWAREGASVTGVDFSPKAIRAARSLATELGIEASFVESNVYDLRHALTGAFDIVFASYGVLVWLPDIREWARIAAHFLKPGGTFYMVEEHPLSTVIDVAAKALTPRFEHDYFAPGRASEYEDDGTYADPAAKLVNRRRVEFQHTLGEIVTALAEAGLSIEFLHEFPFAAWEAASCMSRGDDGYYHLPADREDLAPFLFSIKATKRV